MLKYNPGRGRRNGIKAIPSAAGVSTLQATRRVPEGRSHSSFIIHHSSFRNARRVHLSLLFVILGLCFVCNLYFVICDFYIPSFLPSHPLTFSPSIFASFNRFTNSLKWGRLYILLKTPYVLLNTLRIFTQVIE